MKKLLILTISFYILAIFQTSFLIHFHISGFVLNLILISIILINFFEKSRDYSGLLGSVIGGFFLDIFSERFFGFWILILLGITLFIKYIPKRYINFKI